MKTNGSFLLLISYLLGSQYSTMEAAELINTPAPAEARGSSVESRTIRLPLCFEPNQGQTASPVKYLARGPGYTVFLAPEEAVLALRRSPSASDVVRLKLLGAETNPAVSGEQELAGRSNYFVGNDPRRWQRQIPTYAQVRYRNVYRGIDLVYHGRDGQLEYDFELAPGVEATGIRLGIEGAGRMRVEEAGDLMLGMGKDEVRFRRPEAYQWTNGERRLVAARYVVQGRKQVGFKLGDYDRTQPVTIDPVLSYSTYLGGTGGDVAYALAVDGSGYAYITGITNSADFPTAGSPPHGTNSGSGDAFIVKLETAGDKLVYATYLGGDGADTGTGLAVASGDVYVSGTTTSANFPVTTDAPQTTYGGNGDAFIAHLNSAGDTFIYSTYLGGRGADFGQAVAVDSSGNAWVTGATQSSDFPLVNAIQPTMRGGSDVFVAKINFSGNDLLYSTYLGGLQADVGQAIALDSSGNAYIAGYTFSSDFPTENPFQGSNAGGPDAFVAKVLADGSALAFSTYLGGSGDDRAMGIAVDATQNVYVAGESRSTDFPTTALALQGVNRGDRDAFIAKLGPSGTSLVFSTLLGGAGADQANAVAVDSAGNAFLTGFTQSGDFPTSNPVLAILGISGGSFCGSNLCADAFVSQVNSSGSGLSYSTYLGGSGADFGQAIALGSSGVAYVAGSTASSNFPAIAGAYQANLAGVAGNAFVAKIDPAHEPGIAIVPAKVNFGNQALSIRSAPETVSIINAGSAPLTIDEITTSGDFLETDDCIGTLAGGGGYCTINITFTPSDLGAATEEISITDGAAGSPHTITVTGTGVTAGNGTVTLSPTSLAFGELKVGLVSDPKTVTITNTGTTTLNINSITAGGDYVQTNTCGASFYVLEVGESCTASVTFQPVGSGARNGLLTVSSTASGSPHSVSLTGTGLAAFSLSSPDQTKTILVGTTSTTFTVAAAAPTGFTGNIKLSCPSGLTCDFEPESIFAGQTSTLTLSDLSAGTANPLHFTVSGTSGAQTATTTLTLLLADFSLSASPALNTIVAGAPATYTVLVTPSNGFNQALSLSCENIPGQSECAFSEASVKPSGSPVSVLLTIRTIKNSSSSSGILPAPFGGSQTPLVLLLIAMTLTWCLIRIRRPQAVTERSLLLSSKIAWAVLALTLLLALVGCRGLSGTGTPTGNYTITIRGTLNSNTDVQRTTTFNLAVT